MLANSATKTTVMDGTQLDFSKIIFGKPKPHAAGGKIIGMLNSDTGRNLIFRAPWLFNWGAREGKTKDGEPNGKYTTSIQFPNTDFPNEKADALLGQMRQLEDFVKNYACANSVAWFGKEMSKELVEHSFSPMLKHPNHKGTQNINFDAPPTLSLKIPMFKGKYVTKVIDSETMTELFDPEKVTEDTSDTPMDYITRGELCPLIESGAIWIINKSVYITWNLIQAAVKPMSAGNGSIGTDWIEGAVSSTMKTGLSNKDVQACTMIADSEDEDEPAPAPAPHVQVKKEKEKEIVSPPETKEIPSAAETKVEAKKRSADEDTETPAVVAKKPKILKKAKPTTTA